MTEVLRSLLFPVLLCYYDFIRLPAGLNWWTLSFCLIPFLCKTGASSISILHPGFSTRISQVLFYSPYQSHVACITVRTQPVIRFPLCCFTLPLLKVLLPDNLCIFVTSSAIHFRSSLQYLPALSGELFPDRLPLLPYDISSAGWFDCLACTTQSMVQ